MIVQWKIIERIRVLRIMTEDSAFVNSVQLLFRPNQDAGSLCQGSTHWQARALLVD